MPELPEVETVRRALASHVSGRVIVAVGADPVQLRRPLLAARLRAELPGRQLTEPRRRGKYLLLDTTCGGALLVHLGMTGRLALGAASGTEPPHTHLRMVLDDGRVLRYTDPRRFGLVHWLDPGAEASDTSLAALGIEPFDPTLPAVLAARVRSRRAPIKSLLLDQHLVAGVGNIYANEALWRARIAPRRAGHRISFARLARLAGALREVLEQAIAQGGTTIRDFASLDAEAGLFAVRLDVYGRAGQPCHACGAPIRVEVLAGRSTFWCARCQR